MNQFEFFSPIGIVLYLFGQQPTRLEATINASIYLHRYSAVMENLIEAIIQPEDTTAVLKKVLSGEALRYIIDFTSNKTGGQNRTTDSNPTGQPPTETQLEYQPMKETFNTINSTIEPVTDNLLADAQFKIDNKTKPLGSLGKLENLAVRTSLVQNNLFPEIRRKLMLVFGADHGITEEGISAYPSEVTFQMVENFFNGGAAINVLCKNYGIDLKVVDMGVKGEFQDNPILIKRKIAQGTRNFAIEPAMSEEEAYQAVTTGMELVVNENKTSRVDMLGVGEIGIGNTTAAAAIISAITGISPNHTAGRGTGLDDKGLQHKAEVPEAYFGVSFLPSSVSFTFNLQNSQCKTGF